MEVVAFANQKGGVAKTTSVYNISTVKAMQGKRVLMIDLDSQCSLTIAAGIEPGEKRLEGYSVLDLFDRKKDPADTIFEVKSVGLDEKLYIIPSDPDLSLVENRLHSLDEKVYFVKDALQKLEEYDFDYVMIDCPPNLGVLVTNSLVAADKVVIPVKAEYLSYRGVKLIKKSIEHVKDNPRMNPDLQVVGLIPTMYRGQTSGHRDVLSMLEDEGEILGTVRESISASNGEAAGLPVVVYEPKSKVAEEYRAIADKI